MCFVLKQPDAACLSIFSFKPPAPVCSLPLTHSLWLGSEIFISLLQVLTLMLDEKVSFFVWRD